MLANAALSVDLRHTWVLLPEIVLAVWGIVVVLADLFLFRHQDSESRRRKTGNLSLIGVVLALLSAFLPLIERFDILRVYGLNFSLNLTGIDPISHPDPIVFFGAISADFL